MLVVGRIVLGLGVGFACQVWRWALPLELLLLRVQCRALLFYGTQRCKN